MTQIDITSLVTASPKVRKFARELGVDINKVSGSERQGRVTESDIKLFVSNKANQKINIENNNNKIELEFPHTEFGEVETKDIPRIKKLA